MIYHMLAGLDLHYADPALHLIPAGQDIDDLDLDRDVSDVWKLLHPNPDSLRNVLTLRPTIVGKYF